jgi:hypothetical protein
MLCFSNRAWVYNDGLLSHNRDWGHRVKYPYDRDEGRQEQGQRAGLRAGQRAGQRDANDARYWSFKNKKSSLDKATDLWTCLFCCCS